jgi:tetratricopeptide (TPR) repeat protein
LIWFTVACLLIALQQAYTRNWPQTYFLAEYQNQVNVARECYNRALYQPLQSVEWNKQADSILTRAHFDEWRMASWMEDSAYNTMKLSAFAGAYKLHGKVLLFNRNYVAAAKHYEASQNFFEQLKLTDSTECLRRHTNILKKIQDRDLSTLALALHDLNNYCSDSIFIARITERIGFSECERIKIKKNYHEAIKCYEGAKKSPKAEDKLIDIEKSIAYCCYQIALSLYEQGEYQRAVKWFLKINKKFYMNPPDIDRYIGKCQFRIGNYAAALKYLDASDGRMETVYYKSCSLIELGMCSEACNLICPLKEADSITPLVNRCKCRCTD